MSFEPVDLGPVGADADADRFERLVGAVMARARPELERRAASQPVLGVLGRWAWPTLAAACIAAVASSIVLLSAGELDPRPGAAVAQQAGFSTLLPEWLAESRTPSSADLVMILEGELP
jgi:hypothetical protein